MSAWRTSGLILGLAAACASAQSLRPGLGSTPYHDALGTGVTFRLWAPAATSVVVAGTFNGWNVGAHPLTSEGTNGIWSADATGVTTGEAYKFVLDGANWRTDPRALAFDGSPYRNSLIVEPGSPVPAAFSPGGSGAAIIYELHVGTFRDPNPSDNLPGTFYDAIAGLDHLVDLGVTDVELLPVADFLSTRSWGYNPAYALAVEDTYGGRDGLRAFAAACHARGLRVLIDVVHNHWDAGGSDVWAFDGASPANSGGVYFYGDAARCCTPWGPRPDYDQLEVRRLILDTVKEYMDLGCDGFRWDALSEMFQGTAGLIPAATNLMREAAALVRARGGTMIAENGAAACRIAFDAEWSYGLHGMLAAELAKSNENAVSAASVASALGATGPSNVVFLENHDTAGLLNSWAQRWPVRVRTNGQSAARAQGLARVGAALALSSRGIPLLFQGQEFGHTNLWHDDRPLEWATAGQEQTLAFYRDLLRLRRNLDGISSGLLSTQLTVTAHSLPAGLTVWRGPMTNPVVILANFSSTGTLRQVAFPSPGWWHVALSTDAAAYGGTGDGLRSVFVTNAATVGVPLPAQGAVVLTQGMPPDGDADGDGLSNAAEQAAGTDPLDPLSAATFLSVRMQAGRLHVEWFGVTGRSHRVEASFDLQTWWGLQTNTGSSADLAVPPGADRLFYRMY